MIGKKDMVIIYSVQKQMQSNFNSVSKNGKYINYLGKKFKVYPSVFWPSFDSMTMIEKYKINKGEIVLDLCTGSGNVAIFSALKGAKKVIALDINPLAIKSAKENVKRYNLNKIISVKKSDMFEALNKTVKFDVITINPPFTNHLAKTFSEKTVWDQNLYAHKTFFKNAKRYLNKNGRIYITDAIFGTVKEMRKLAIKAGFKIKKINEKKITKQRIYYAFELTPA